MSFASSSSHFPGYGGEQIPPCLTGYFLISEANMLDPNFYRTVVLIVGHNREGAFGLVVNRRSPLTLEEVLPRMRGSHGSSTPIYIGGPVQQDYLFVIHSEMPEAHQASDVASQLVPGVIFEPSFQHVEQYLCQDEPPPLEEQLAINLYLGYSGWAAQQLEQEMEAGAWIVHPVQPKIVFHHDPEKSWHEALRKKGGIYKVFADSNPNPLLN